jgi:hypothetical protein
MTARSSLPPRLEDRGFTVAEAVELGVGRKRLRGRDLERPFWGVRVRAGSATDVAGLAEAFAGRMPARAFYSHATAALLWGIPLPWSLRSTTSLDVSVPEPLTRIGGRGITSHRLRITADDTTIVHGLRVTSLERTLLDLASQLEDEDFLAAGDNVLWRRRARRGTVRSLGAALERFPGRRGRPRAEAMIPLMIDRSDSAPESVFRLRFLRAGFPPMIANQDVYDADGRFIAMPDLQLPQYRMAFDYEGDHHRTDPVQWRKDLRRVPRLQDANWHHTRISADDLASPDELLARTRRLLLTRGWRP